MNQLFNRAAQYFRKNSVVVILVGGVVLFVFGKQVNKLFAWIRSRFQGAVINKSVVNAVADDSGTSPATVSQVVREETCQGVADAVYSALHENFFGFLPSSIFGSKNDLDTVVDELNSLKNGTEAKYVSSYYYQKYGSRLKAELTSDTSKFINILAAGVSSIRPEIWNNLN